MTRCRLPLLAALLLFPFQPARADGPAALLEQAIREKQAARPADAARDLVRQADRLADQRRFDEAIDLYERAYRLDPANDATYARLLLVRNAAGRLSAEDREALRLIQQTEAHRIEQTLARVRLQIIQARQALRAGDGAVATQRARSATSQLDSLPPDLDISAYRRELRTLLTAARRRDHANAKSAARDATPPDAESHSPRLSDAGATTTPTDEFTGGYAPSGRVIDDADVGPDGARFRAERERAADVARNRVRWLYETMNSADPPLADLTYPADWPDKSRRRARYRDGVVYQSQPFPGPDGQEYYTVIYDLAELAHPVPNFRPTHTGDRLQELNAQLDRHYLRTQSYIFRGDAADLAAGLPLLPYFGGVDNWAVSPPFDAREVERITRIVEDFLARQAANPPPDPAPQGTPNDAPRR